MSKRKKKNAATLILLLVALAALSGVYFWYSKKGDEKEEAAKISLVEIDADAISSIHYLREDTDITFVKQDDKWISRDEPDRPIYQNYVNSIVNAIKSIQAERIVSENPERLADYGLDNPQTALEITLNDGKVIIIKLGSQIIDSKGYYGLVNDGNIVYQLPNSIGNVLKRSDVEFTDVEDTPDVESSNITYFKVALKNGTEYEFEKETELFFNNAGNTFDSWKILKPYGETYTADGTKIQEQLEYYTNLNFLSCVDYKGEDLSKYGLDEPYATVHVDYYETRTETLETPEKDPETGEEIKEKTVQEPREYTLFIGDKNEDGNYYVRLEGSKAVHVMDDEKIDNMINIKPFDLLHHFALMPNISQVDWIEAEVNGTLYRMEITHKTEKDDEGEEKTISTYYYNGREVEEKAFKKLYQTMISSQYDAEVSEEVNLEGKEPVLSLSFHLFGEGEGTYSAKFYRYNDSFDIIEKPDGKVFFADKRDTDAIMNAISSFTGKTSE